MDRHFYYLLFKTLEEEQITICIVSIVVKELRKDMIFKCRYINKF